MMKQVRLFENYTDEEIEAKAASLVNAWVDMGVEDIQNVEADIEDFIDAQYNGGEFIMTALENRGNELKWDGNMRDQHYIAMEILLNK